MVSARETGCVCDGAQLYAFRPQLLPSLAGVIQTNADARFMSPNPLPEVSLMLRRSLHTLNQLIKEIGGARLPAGVQLTAQVRSLDAYLIQSLSALNTDCERHTPVSYGKIRKIRHAPDYIPESFHCCNHPNSVGYADHSPSIQMFVEEYGLVVDTPKEHPARRYGAGESNNGSAAHF